MNKNIRNIGIAIGILVLLSIVAMAAIDYTGVVRTTRAPGYSATFGNFVELGVDDVEWMPYEQPEIVNVSFYLPVDAYIHVSSFGDLTCVSATCSESTTANLWITMDRKDVKADWDGYHIFHKGSFSLSSMYKLKKGYHTAYVLINDGDNLDLNYMSANIVVTATQKGTIGRNSWFFSEFVT